MLLLQQPGQCCDLTAFPLVVEQLFGRDLRMGQQLLPARERILLEGYVDLRKELLAGCPGQTDTVPVRQPRGVSVFDEPLFKEAVAPTPKTAPQDVDAAGIPEDP